MTTNPFNGTEPIIADALEEWGDEDSRYRDFTVRWATFIRNQCNGVGTGERQLKDTMLPKVIRVLTGRVYVPDSPVNASSLVKSEEQHYWFIRHWLHDPSSLGAVFFHRGFPGVFRCNDMAMLLQKDSAFNIVRKKIPIYGVKFDDFAYRSPILTPGDKTTDYVPFFQGSPLEYANAEYRIPLAKRWRPSIVVNAMLKFNIEHSVFIESLEEYFGLKVFK